MRIKAPYGVLFVAIAVLALLGAPWSASAVTESWVSRYISPGSTAMYVYTNSMVGVDANGNVYASGYGYRAAASNSYYDYVTVKYDSNGVQQWVRVWNTGPSRYDYARALDVTPSGNVYVTGYADPPAGGSDDIFTVGYDTNGNLLGTARYNGPGNGYDYGRSVKVDPSGNVYVHGYSYNGSNYDHVTIKYTPTLSQLWVSRYDSGQQDYATDGRLIAFGASGEVFVGAYSYNYVGSTSYYDFAVQSLNATTGAQNWVRHFNGAGDSYDYLNAIDTDSSGNVYASGYGYGNVYYDYQVVSWDAAGNQRWTATYNGPPGNGYDRATDMAEYNGTVFVSGYSYDYSPNYYDMTTVAFNSATGATQWVQRWDNGNTGTSYRYDYGYSLAVDQYGVYAVGYGSPYVGTYYYYDYTTVAYSHTGTELWAMRYNNPARNYYDYGYSVTSDDAGCVYTHGRSYQSYQEYATVKYCEDVACPEVTARASGPYNIECNAPTTSFVVDGSRSCDPNDQPLTYNWVTDCPGGRFDGSTNATTTLSLTSPPPCPVNCDTTLTVRNPQGVSDSDTADVMVEDTTDPWWDYFPPNYTWECDSVQGPATVTSSDVCDPDVPVFFNERINCGNCDANYTIFRDWDASDDCGNRIANTQTITIQDTEVPIIHNASDENKFCLWSPNHEFYCWTMADFPVIATDNCELNYTQQCETGEPDITWWIDAVYSDQPDNGTGDGNTVDDIRVSENGSWFCVRAERDGSILYGRHYSVWMRAADDCGNTTDSTLMGNIYIPHDSSEHDQCLNADQGK